MAIPYTPRIGQVLWCNYDFHEKPEMTKNRLVVVVSPKLRERWGICTVVPISTTPPNPIMGYHFQLSKDPLPTSPPETVVWAKCDMINAVSIERLSGYWREIVDGKRRYEELFVPRVDLIGIQRGIVDSIALAHLKIVIR